MAVPPLLFINLEQMACQHEPKYISGPNSQSQLSNLKRKFILYLK
jgi:hypothetical protein